MKREKYITKSDEKELIGLFYDFESVSVDELTNSYVKQSNIEITEKNRKLNAQINKLEKELERSKNSRATKGVSYKNIQEKIEKEFSYLDEKSRKILATAEYGYLNEKDDLDYSGIYIGYIKVLELELRSKLGMREKFTFGNMIQKLEKKENLKTFVNYLYANQILDTRNKAVHYDLITKNECGKLRKILIEDGWLSNLIFVLENKVVPTSIHLERIDVLVTECTGSERYQNRVYYVYETFDGILLLSQGQIKTGSNTFAAKFIEHNGLEYYLV